VVWLLLSNTAEERQRVPCPCLSASQADIPASLDSRTLTCCTRQCAAIIGVRHIAFRILTVQC
jgi:hypothetical protein